jgi:hypothetical protein
MQPGVGSFTRDFERWMKGGSGSGASRSVKGTWRGVRYWGPCRLCRVRFQRQTSLSIGTPLGNVAHLPWTFERWMKGALGVKSLYLRELYEGNLEGGLLY